MQAKLHTKVFWLIYQTNSGASGKPAALASFVVLQALRVADPQACASQVGAEAPTAAELRTTLAIQQVAMLWLQPSLPEHLLLHAECHLCIARTLHKLDRFQDALKHTKAALRLRKQSLEPSDARVADAERYVARTLWKLNRKPQALKHFEAVLAMRQAQRPIDRLAVAEAQ